ncbi:MAG: phosphoribosylformylglycinamidine cyclo-ligase, partial [Candidatus Binataceae bacterium]
MARRLTYRQAGVDIALKQRLVPLFRTISKRAGGAGVIGGIGAFGAMIALDQFKRMRAPVMVAGTDGVGTKLKLAFMTGRHDTVGIDCVAMCVNDIICHNARPLFFLDYIGCGKLDQKIALTIVDGVARGCAESGMSLVGGETAQLPGMYKPGEYDLAGFAVGMAERAAIPRPQSMRAGDVLVALASNGLHSNGFSLARKVLLERARLKLGARVAELGDTLANELLRPTRLYAKNVIELFRR